MTGFAPSVPDISGCPETFKTSLKAGSCWHVPGIESPSSTCNICSRRSQHRRFIASRGTAYSTRQPKMPGGAQHFVRMRWCEGRFEEKRDVGHAVWVHRETVRLHVERHGEKRILGIDEMSSSYSPAGALLVQRRLHAVASKSFQDGPVGFDYRPVRRYRYKTVQVQTCSTGWQSQCRKNNQVTWNLPRRRLSCAAVSAKRNSNASPSAGFQVSGDPVGSPKAPGRKNSMTACSKEGRPVALAEYSPVQKRKLQPVGQGQDHGVPGSSLQALDCNVPP